MLTRRVPPGLTDEDSDPATPCAPCHSGTYQPEEAWVGHCPNCGIDTFDKDGWKFNNDDYVQVRTQARRSKIVECDTLRVTRFQHVRG